MAAAPEGGELVWLSADPAGQNHARKVVRSKAAAWSHSNGDRRHNNGRHGHAPHPPHAPPPPAPSQSHHPHHPQGPQLHDPAHPHRSGSATSLQDPRLLYSRPNNDPRLDPALQHFHPSDHYAQPPPHHQQQHQPPPQPAPTREFPYSHAAQPQAQYYTHTPHHANPQSLPPQQPSTRPALIDPAKEDHATALSRLRAESTHHSEMDEALNGRIASLEQAISGLQNDMRNIVSATEDIRTMLQERRQQEPPPLPHQSHNTTDHSDFLALSSQVTAVGKKGDEVDAMKAQLETMRLRMKTLEDEHSRNAVVTPSPPAYSKW